MGMRILIVTYTIMFNSYIFDMGMRIFDMLECLTVMLYVKTNYCKVSIILFIQVVYRTSPISKGLGYQSMCNQPFVVEMLFSSFLLFVVPFVHEYHQELDMSALRDHTWVLVVCD